MLVSVVILLEASPYENEFFVSNLRVSIEEFVAVKRLPLNYGKLARNLGRFFVLPCLRNTFENFLESLVNDYSFRNCQIH